ncbi:hypothetical protein BDQ17DRAFT_1432889 [Cyathus striatus]|nr:hypothetical protein BDQ17DRAFT_1432889 [Cyathus striatus]
MNADSAAQRAFIESNVLEVLSSLNMSATYLHQINRMQHPAVHQTLFLQGPLGVISFEDRDNSETSVNAGQLKEVIEWVLGGISARGGYHNQYLLPLGPRSLENSATSDLNAKGRFVTEQFLENPKRAVCASIYEDTGYQSTFLDEFNHENLGKHPRDWRPDYDPCNWLVPGVVTKGS